MAKASRQITPYKGAGKTTGGASARPAARDAGSPAPAQSQPLIRFRPYQAPVFNDRTTGILVLHWSRQIGKSFTLASWAVDRLLTRPGRLVTVLSNSRDNGAEFLQKCTEVCRLMGLAEEQVTSANVGDANVFVAEDQSADLSYEAMRMELRITLRDPADGTLLLVI